MIREACVGSFVEGKKAEALGANRLELCDNLAVGGTTPSYGTIMAAKKYLSIPSLVMIRPRGGNFVYDEVEMEMMINDIKVCKEIGIAGVVFGVLTVDNELDMPKMKKLVEMSKPMEITCHMAFDETSNLSKTLEQLIELGIDRVLTKGSKTNALDGIETLKHLVKQAEGRIKIVAGGGVNEGNYAAVAQQTNVEELHGTKIVGAL